MTQWTTAHIGDHDVVRSFPVSPAWTGTRHRVVEVVDSCGRHWFVKRVADSRVWAAEVRAYRRWLPALAGHVPDLRAVHAESLSLLLSAVPGTRPHPDGETSRQAGELLRRLHGCRPPRQRAPWSRERFGRMLRGILARHPGLLRPAEEAFVRGEVEVLLTLEVGDAVPCHGDYHPRNWLRDDRGVLRVIDFSGARRDPPTVDLARLALTTWWDRPELVDPFLEGYGRALGGPEVRHLRALMAFRAVAEVARARDRGHAAGECFGRDRLRDLMAGRAPALGAAASPSPHPRRRLAGLLVRRAPD